MKGLETVIAAAGILMLGYWAVVYSSAGLYQATESRRFVSNRSRTAVAVETPGTAKTVRNVPQPGSMIAKIEIPRIGIAAVVVEGADEQALRFAPGHIRGTSMPGEGGNIGVAGHRDTFFRPLRFVRNGDEIELITPVGELRYKVVSTEIVEPNEVRVLYPTERETLTLVTCYPFYFLGAAPKRFVVRAECANCSVRRNSSGIMIGNPSHNR